MMGSFGTETQQAVVSWFSILIARSCMHDIYYICMCFGVGGTPGSSSAQIECSKKTPGNTPLAKARPSQDGQRGLQRQRERDGGCRANRFRRKTRGVFIIYSKGIFKKSSQGLTCVLLLYCCTSRHCRRSSWENEKYVIITTRPNPNPNPIWNAMG